MLTHILNRLSKAREKFNNDSLFRNATYLIFSTAIMSALGFLFWVFVAHLYVPAAIGQASALIAITTFISNLSLLGLNAGLMRFLPKSKDQSGDINAATIVVVGVTITAAAIYVFIGTRIGGNLALLTSNWHKIAFIVLMSTVSLNTLTDAVFIANRKAEYHTVCYSSFGLVKLVLPLLLIPFASLGIFLAYILAVITSLTVSYYLMWRRCGYHFRARPNWSLLPKTRTYASHNYIGVVLAGLPAQLLPLLIIRRLGAAQVAYFSMAWTMANLLYIIPTATCQSLLAESSHEPGKQTLHISRTVKLLAKILIPAVALAIIVAPYLLDIFGHTYKQNGTVVFQLMAFSTFFIAINAVRSTVLNIEKRTAGIIFVQFVTVIATFFSALLLLRHGLAGVGLAMLIGYAASNIAHLYLYLRHKAYKSKHEEHLNTKLRNASLIDNRVFLQQTLNPYGVKVISYSILKSDGKNTTILINATSKKFVAKKMVVRFYTLGTQNISHIDEENRFVTYLDKRGMPVPSILTNNDNMIVSKISIGDNEWHYIVMKFADGKHPAHYTEYILRSMARYQAQIHVEGLAYARTCQSPYFKLSTTEWKSILLSPFVPRGYSHFDYDASNILVTDDSVSCILDFEGMRYGPFVACIYLTLKSIYEQNRSTADLFYYLSAYQKLRKLKFIEKLIIYMALVFRFKDPKILYKLRNISLPTS